VLIDFELLAWTE